MKKIVFIAAFISFQFGYALANSILFVPEKESDIVASIITSPSVMVGNITLPKEAPDAEIWAERDRRRLRESVLDLSRCLETMTGLKVAVVTNETLSQGIPIYIGDDARRVFGRVKKHYRYNQAFRVIVSRKNGIGLYGEGNPSSTIGSSYAIYTLLDRLGCRWWFAGDLGESIPVLKEPLKIDTLDETIVPSTYSRGCHLYAFDEPFIRRTRSYQMPQYQYIPIEKYVPKEEMELHPDWYGRDEKGNKWLRNWSSNGFAKRIAEIICERQRERARKVWCLTPEDGSVFDKSPANMALDTGDWDTTYQQTALTDRLLSLCNRIMTDVDKKYPDLVYHVLAYVQYTRPPLREKPKKNLRVEVAPITYDRVRPMTMTNSPNNAELQYIVNGWGKLCPHDPKLDSDRNVKKENIVNGTAWYFYAYNLGDELTPCPMFRKVAVDLPIIYEKGSCMYWNPETRPNNEFFAATQWSMARYAWDRSLDLNALFKEAVDGIYGDAGDAMWAFFDEVDRQYVEGNNEYAGASFGNLRRFPEEWINKTTLLMEKAKSAAVASDDEKIKQRVEMTAVSWERFVKDMAMRRDFADGRWADLKDRADSWCEEGTKLAKKYAENLAFCTYDNYGIAVWRIYFYSQAEVAARIANNAKILVSSPIRNGEWKIEGREWAATDIALDTWSHLGLHNYFGSMDYRFNVDVSERTADKKVWLWISMADNNVSVKVNGRKCPGARDDNYKEGTGLKENVSCGWKPRRFDITEAVKTGMNKIEVTADRSAVLTEIGIGGLMGPMTIFEE